MKHENSLKLRGSYKIYDGDKLVREGENLIPDAGYDFICNVIGLAAQPAEMAYIAVGTNSTAPAAGNTALGAEVASSRTAATYAHTAGTKTMTLTTTFGAGVGTGALTEVGIFNASSGGTMISRHTFSVYNKGAGDSLTVVWTLTLS